MVPAFFSGRLGNFSAAVRELSFYKHGLFSYDGYFPSWARSKALFRDRFFWLILVIPSSFGSGRAGFFDHILDRSASLLSQVFSFPISLSGVCG